MISDVSMESAGSTDCTPSIVFEIPDKDRAWATTALPLEVQSEVKLLLKCCEEIHGAANKKQECKRLSAWLQRNGKRRGMSPVSLERNYYKIRRSGDWRDLIDRNKVKADSRALPQPFVEFFKTLCERNQRCVSQAYNELLLIWRTGFDANRKQHTEIPGYSEWPKAALGADIPAGWSRGHLYRHTPTQYELRAARIGRKAASDIRLKVYTSRVGLRLGEYLEFDDHEYNLKVNFPGQKKAMRPRGFSVIDVLSACCFSQSFKPTLWDEEAQKKRALTEDDMMWFVVNTLTSHGYRTDDVGTKLVVEWGTAAIKEAFEGRIFDATSGRVLVERSGKFGQAAHSGQFDGKSGGNYRFKALVESLFNLVDNYLASLPGQVGKDRLHAPEESQGGMMPYNERLLKVASVMAPERSASLKFPVLSWPEFIDRALWAYQRINDATEHELEGWQRLGFVTQEWRLNAELPWLPESNFLALPESEQMVARALVEQNPLLSRSRKLSRREVWNQHKNELTPLPMYQWPALMGLERGREMTVRERVFEMSDWQISGDPLRFHAVDDFGQPLHGRYLCFVNPFQTGALVACDAKGRVKGICPAIDAPCRNDSENVKRAMGRAAKDENRLLQPLQARHADEARARKAMHRHNAAVISGKPVTEEERDRAATDRKAARFGKALMNDEPKETRTEDVIEEVDLT